MRYRVKEAKAPYLWTPEAKTFLPSDDKETLGYKTECYIEVRGLGGAMFWKLAAILAKNLLDTLHKGLFQ